MSEAYLDGSCQDCRFWEAIEQPVNLHSGRCRRHAPLAVQFGQTEREDETQGAADAVWPTTDNSDWCGEFVARP